METKTIRESVKNLKKGKFLSGCDIPLGYCPCLPLLSVKNECLCLIVPFLKSKVTGIIDETYIYPIRFVVTLELPTERIVAYSNLEYDEAYAELDFEQPISKFRHDAVKNLNKNEYHTLIDEVYTEYDKIVNYLIGKEGAQKPDEIRFSELLKILIDPRLHPFYQALDTNFYHKYIEG